MLQSMMHHLTYPNIFLKVTPYVHENLMYLYESALKTSSSPFFEESLPEIFRNISHLWKI